VDKVVALPLGHEVGKQLSTQAKTGRRKEMKITFNLYGGSGFISKNTLDAEQFAEFRKIAESLKQSVKIEAVQS
jgi:hypothetical protein